MLGDHPFEGLYFCLALPLLTQPGHTRAGLGRRGDKASGVIWGFSLEPALRLEGGAGDPVQLGLPEEEVEELARFPVRRDGMRAASLHGPYSCPPVTVLCPFTAAHVV